MRSERGTEKRKRPQWRSDLPKSMTRTSINLARLSGINLHISAVLLSGPETRPVFVNPEFSQEVSSSFAEV